jgi:DNA-binding HxlR family transcriptional regulator
MAALDLLGRRWALRVLWELRDGPVGARELRERCDQVSPSVLYERLRELSDTGIVTRDGQRYQLSTLGHELRGALEPLSAWSAKWAGSVGDSPQLPPPPRGRNSR